MDVSFTIGYEYGSQSKEVTQNSPVGKVIDMVKHLKDRGEKISPFFKGHIVLDMSDMPFEDFRTLINIITERAEIVKTEIDATGSESGEQEG